MGLGLPFTAPPPPPPAEVIVEKIELVPGLPLLTGAGFPTAPGIPAPPAPTVIGYPVAVTGNALTPEVNGALGPTFENVVAAALSPPAPPPPPFPPPAPPEAPPATTK